MTTIVLADDHHIVRHGLRVVLGALSDFEVVGEASTGVEALALVERLRPDVLISDVMMPDLNGLEVARQISKRFPSTRVIILSAHAKESYVLEALRSGVSGYILKGAEAGELVDAVRQVLSGKHYLSPPLAARAILNYVQNAKDTPHDLYETLTAREREVLQLTAQGHSSAEIGERLSISPRTAETHRANAMHKLGLHSQVDLIRFALRRGILPMDDDDVALGG